MDRAPASGGLLGTGFICLLEQPVPLPSLDRPARVQLSDPHLSKCTSLRAGLARGSYPGHLFVPMVLPVTRHYVTLPWPEEWGLQFL